MALEVYINSLALGRNLGWYHLPQDMMKTEKGLGLF